MKYNLSQHAQDVLKEREILDSWVEHVLLAPERCEPDRSDKSVEHRLGRVIEHGNRVLRVVVNKETEPVTVVTSYFDRKMRDAL